MSREGTASRTRCRYAPRQVSELCTFRLSPTRVGANDAADSLLVQLAGAKVVLTAKGIDGKRFSECSLMPGAQRIGCGDRWWCGSG